MIPCFKVYWITTMRTIQQNKLYHEYCGKLKLCSVIKIYDGRFELQGISNPIVFRPNAFGYDTFRELIKAIDLNYPKDGVGRPLSSTKITKEDMNSHILFLECLLSEY